MLLVALIEQFMPTFGIESNSPGVFDDVINS